MPKGDIVGIFITDRRQSICLSLMESLADDDKQEKVARPTSQR
jgi:hypothetical protein